MTRTTKDTFIKSKTIDAVKAAVLNWASQNKVKVLINNQPSVFAITPPSVGTIVISKNFEAVIMPLPRRPYTMYIPPRFWPDARTFVPEREFSESGFAYGGIPRKEGMEAIKRLWAALEVLSNA